MQIITCVRSPQLNKDGWQDGLRERWHKNGQLKERCTYKDGEKVHDLSAEEAERLITERQGEKRSALGFCYGREAV